MSYLETVEQVFYYFSKDERKKIEKFLEDHEYEWETNNVCGECCGMYADEYWVGGVGGDIKAKDKKAFVRLCKKEKIACSINDYTISADPSSGEEYQISN